MATLFRGMGRDDFLDGLVQATGKNGRELYDYLKEMIESHQEQVEKPEDFPREFDGTASFTGTREEFYGFLELHGGKRYNKNGLDTWSACTVDALASYASKLLRVEYFDFFWALPNGNGHIRICGENPEKSKKSQNWWKKV